MSVDASEEPARIAQASPRPGPRDALPGRAQFEVIPLPGTLESVIAHLPRGARVSVTSSPAQGQEATLALSIDLARAGFTPIPHLAARRITGSRQAQEIAARLGEVGIGEAFVIAGDPARPAGPFSGALELLEALHSADPGLALGVGGYPEGHPYLTPGRERELLRRKAEHAGYAVTQMCFEAEHVLRWVRSLREAGIDLQVRPGVAGPVSRTRLLKVGRRVGVGASLRMLHRHGSGMRHLAGPGAWHPDALLDELGRHRGDPRLGLLAPHVYTFNALEETAAWWTGR
ncbi:methylenetetrahydrofolate reductase [Brachybacterium hainanense]|uniref:Methylenetetrahydrofolate reductase n=1 Tax=Brachybacterium hainanense TaxID=1541174 RepID=A0ABV6RAJ4_9MICO